MLEVVWWVLAWRSEGQFVHKWLMDGSQHPKVSILWTAALIVGKQACYGAGQPLQINA